MQIDKGTSTTKERGIITEKMLLGITRDNKYHNHPGPEIDMTHREIEFIFRQLFIGIQSNYDIEKLRWIYEKPD